MHLTLQRTLWESHDIEDPIELIMVIGVAGFNVLLATVKDGFRRHELRKDASDCPDI